MQNNASNSQNVGIKNSWSLVAFAKMKGKASIGDCTNHETAEVFKALAFTDPNDQTRTFVTFSSNLGELSPEEVMKQKENLQVVELESGNYKLCKRGNSSWQDLEI